MKKLITAQEFERAFRSQWKKDRCSRSHGEKIKDLIPDWDERYGGWTTFMLGEKVKEENKKAFSYYEGDTEAFFYRVLQKLKRKDMKFFRELKKPITDEKLLSPELKEKYKEFSNKCYYKFDGVYGNDNPLRLDVLIEHENDYDRIEEEMWKLLMFRSPLKVLVSYDYSEKKKTTPRRMNFLKCKLKKLAKMAREVDEDSKEAEETEYLIVIGNLNVDDIVIWEFKKFSKNYQWVNNS